MQRGFLRSRSGNFDAARADMDRAIELEPKNAFGYLARGNLKIEQKVWAEALADFSQAIGLRPDLAPAFAGRARANLETAQFDPALGDLNTAIAITPNVPNAFFLRGQIYRRKGDIDHAIEDFSRATAQRNQTERAAYFARGQLFSANGDYARAIADYDKLLSLMPDNKEVQQQREQAIAMQAELAKTGTKSPGDSSRAGATCGSCGSPRQGPDRTGPAAGQAGQFRRRGLAPQRNAGRRSA